MIRLVLFDIDGTLIRTGGAGVKAFAKVFETEFKATDGFEKLKFAGRTDVSLVREFFDVHGIDLSPQNLERFFERYVFWLDHILAECDCRVIPGVWEFINDLKHLPTPPVRGLLTGNFRLGAEIKLRKLNLWHEFKTGAFADDSEFRDKIAAIARDRGAGFLRTPLRDEEVLVIGDTPHDIKCARAIGAKVLAVGTGGSTMDELRAHKPDWLAQDLNGIRATDVCE